MNKKQSLEHCYKIEWLEHVITDIIHWKPINTRPKQITTVNRQFQNTTFSRLINN